MNFRALPPFGGDARAVAEVVNGLMQGKSNNTGTVTLTAGATTTLIDPRLGADSVVLLMPASSSAPSAGVYVTDRQKGQCTLNHASGVNRVFSYVIVG